MNTTKQMQTATIHHLPTSVEKQLSIEGIMELPEPLTPSDCDLSAFPYFSFDAAKFRNSDFALTVDPAAGFYAVMLWSAAWHQIPAASLPDNNMILFRLSGCRSLDEWNTLKDQAMYGFIKCRDGRWYHKHLALHASKAWEKSRKAKSSIASRWVKETKEEWANNEPSTDEIRTYNDSNTNVILGEERRGEEREDNNPLYPPCSETEAPKPKATGKQSPKKDGTKLTQAWLEENTEAMKQVYFTKMRENELKATEQRWSYIRGDFVEHWINSATNADKFKKVKWLDTWENQVEKQINYNKLKWKAEESSRTTAHDGSKSKLGSLDDDYTKYVDWGRVFKGEG